MIVLLHLVILFSQLFSTFHIYQVTLVRIFRPFLSTQIHCDPLSHSISHCKVFATESIHLSQFVLGILLVECCPFSHYKIHKQYKGYPSIASPPWLIMSSGASCDPGPNYLPEKILFCSSSRGHSGPPVSARLIYK